MPDDTTKALPGAMRVDEEQLQGHVDEAVRTSVEENLNGLLEAEADRPCGAERYERAPNRTDSRAGHYAWKLQTKAGAVTLKAAETADALLRDSDHRAGPARGGVGGRSVGGDVSRRRQRAPRRGHHRGPVGHPSPQPFLLGWVSSDSSGEFFVGLPGVANHHRVAQGDKVAGIKEEAEPCGGAALVFSN